MSTLDITLLDEALPELGLDHASQMGVIRLLYTCLADEHVLYIKLRNYHWNVTGPQFFSLHELFEQQYTALATTIDAIAERIVQYGAEAPGTMTEFLAAARLDEHTGPAPSAHQMLEAIVADHEALIKHLREDLATAGDTYGDAGVEDFFTGLLQAHQEFAWMTRAFLKGMPI